MAKRNWIKVMNDLLLLILGIQDASLLSENIVIAAESLGLGSCFIGDTPYYANEIIQNYKLPKRVFPMVQRKTRIFLPYILVDYQPLHHSNNIDLILKCYRNALWREVRI